MSRNKKEQSFELLCSECPGYFENCRDCCAAREMAIVEELPKSLSLEAIEEEPLYEDDYDLEELIRHHPEDFQGIYFSLGY